MPQPRRLQARRRSARHCDDGQPHRHPQGLAAGTGRGGAVGGLPGRRCATGPQRAAIRAAPSIGTGPRTRGATGPASGRSAAGRQPASAGRAWRRRAGASATRAATHTPTLAWTCPARDRRPQAWALLAAPCARGDSPGSARSTQPAASAVDGAASGCPKACPAWINRSAAPDAAARCAKSGPRRPQAGLGEVCRSRRTGPGAARAGSPARNRPGTAPR